MSANPDQVGTQTAQPRRTAFEQRLGTKPKRPGLPHRIAAVWRDEYDTLVNWPRGLRHLLSRGAAYLLVNAVALLLVAWLLPGVEIAVGFPGNVLAALALTLLAGAITFLVRPVVFLALGLDNVILTAVLTIIFMGLTLLVASWFMASVQIDGLIAATTASLIIAAINTALTAVIGLDEDESFYRHSLKRMARSSGDVDERPGPGFVIIQVDGLAEPILRNALRTGYMPFISDWLASGEYRLGKWEALAPSMTSAGQVGILHGAHAGIPAFRWWEKERDYLMVSNHPDDAYEIERRASAEHGGERDLLRDGGASISNLVSGGASRSIATNSQLSKDGQGLQMSSFSLFLLNPYNITRGGGQFLASVVTELFQARRQRVRDIKPRISRSWPFPFLKASTTTIMRDMLTDLVIGEMGRGTPIIYADYLGYDEIAHHAGPERPETMEQLDRVDRMMRSLSRAAEDAPRRYHFIMVSDHGQTQGAPFHDRYGVTLEELIRSLMEGEVTSLDATNDVEGWGAVNTFLTEASRTPGTTGRVVRRTMRGSTEDGVVSLGATDGLLKGARVGGADGAEKAAIRSGATVPDLVVAASGNLANVYFPEIRERLSLEGIAARTPISCPASSGTRASASSWSARRSTGRSSSAATGCATSTPARSRAGTRSRRSGSMPSRTSSVWTASTTSATSSSSACTTRPPTRSRRSSTRSARTVASGACRPRPSCSIRLPSSGTRRRSRSWAPRRSIARSGSGSPRHASSTPPGVTDEDAMARPSVELPSVLQAGRQTAEG